MNDADRFYPVMPGPAAPAGPPLARRASARYGGAWARSVRFAAFFSDEPSAVAAVDRCRGHGLDHRSCRLLRAADAHAAGHMPRSAQPLASMATGLWAVIAGAGAGAGAGAVFGGLAGSLFVGITTGLQFADMQDAAITGAALGAALGAAAAGWLTFGSATARSARRFDVTVLRRLRQGDTGVMISGLSWQQMAAPVAELEARCQRWCHDAPSDGPL